MNISQLIRSFKNEQSGKRFETRFTYNALLRIMVILLYCHGSCVGLPKKEMLAASMPQINRLEPKLHFYSSVVVC